MAMSEYELSLVIDAKKGKKKSLDRLYDAFHKKMMEEVDREVGNRDHAEVILKGAFEKAKSEVKSLQNPMEFEPMIIAITIAECHNYLSSAGITGRPAPSSDDKGYANFTEERKPGVNAAVQQSVAPQPAVSQAQPAAKTYSPNTPPVQQPVQQQQPQPVMNQSQPAAKTYSPNVPLVQQPVQQPPYQQRQPSYQQPSQPVAPAYQASEQYRAPQPEPHPQTVMQPSSSLFTSQQGGSAVQQQAPVTNFQVADGNQVGYLVCTKGDSVGNCFNLSAGYNHVGLSSDCDIIFKDNALDPRFSFFLVYEDSLKACQLIPGEFCPIPHIGDAFADSAIYIGENDVIRAGNTEMIFIPA